MGASGLSRLATLPLATLTALVLLAPPALANVPLTQIGADPFTNPTSQHQTIVEPDTYHFGSTIVAVAQSGRFFDGGASGIAFATSTNNGATWTQGVLPGITTFQGGPYDRVTDPAIAYDPQDGVWIASTLGLSEAGGVHGAAVLASRSADGITWGPPVVVSTGNDPDKNWIVCDTTATSPFYGNCYTEYDNFGDGDRIQMSTSTDGGLTWGTPKATANNATGLGGQPVVQPNGTVVVPIANAFETQILAFVSTNGGATWSRTRRIANVNTHTVAGGLRTGPLPSAEIDASGKVYVVWQDCRFQSGCPANDIVMSTSANGTQWSAITRVTNDGGDHFIPGVAVDRSTSGASARLAVTYYRYPTAGCTAATCQLTVGYRSSTNGGASWSASTQLAGPMNLAWIASTSQGPMVGDYISTSIVPGGNAYPAIAVATANSGSTFFEHLYTAGLGVTAGSVSAETAPANGGNAGTTPAAQHSHRS
ncbi:sialidase family protein [Nonomuraea sp. NPDC050556]|uniref:sialidase family protein n=1 Tax=Nonomuraea sp. NPDC050556 TaxID=3364369 RepID=UPI0037A2894F